MSIQKKCIICEKEGEKRIANNIDMRYCSQCDFMWREVFDVGIAHYESKTVDCSDLKIESRLRNARQRISILKSHITLDNLCDIGCGEGVFIQALKEVGRTNVFGIEPSDVIANYAQEHNIRIYKGTIESAKEILVHKNIQTISLFHLIEHLHAPHDALNMLKSSLPIDGNIIIETPDLNSFSLRKTGFMHRLVYDEHLFYFSKKSLRLLLEKSGFLISAEGYRDFDMYSMSMKEILKRFGLNVPVPQNENVTTDGDSGTKQRVASSGLLSKVKNALRILVINILIRVRQGDYIWVIAKKVS